MIPDEGAIATGTVLVGKYRIESVIGRGGMGLVYRAHHLALGESVAIKVLRRDVSRDTETVARFVREAQSAVQLKSEHVARIRDVGTFEDLPYMVMEFLEGADLGQLVDTNGAMNVPVAVDLVLQASDAIAEAHSLGIVHRDIKPSNLFVSFRPDQTAIVKVLDFGISKSASGADLSLTQTSSMLGTPAYMSPEQMRSARDVDARTDVWSLGTVLYELVEGRRPFEAESFSEMCVMVAVDAPAPMTLARELEPIIMKCLAKKADDRYPNVPALMQDLAFYAGNPDAARHFITRAYRVLGMRVPSNLDSSPSIRPPVTYQTPVPSMQLSTLMGAAATPAHTALRSAVDAPMMGVTTVSDHPRKGNRALAVILVLCVLTGVGGAIGYVKATETDQVAVVPESADAATDEGSADQSSAGSAAGSATATLAGSGSDAGSAIATGTGSGSDAGSAAAGSNEPLAGSGAGAGSGPKPRSGSATVATGGGKGQKGGAKPKGGGKGPKGGTAEAGKGAGSGSAKAIPQKKCDVFDSIRSGC